ncbi:MAG: hypothetical protein PHG05_01320 [Candidatus Nanoarchaeia archaeon]|nr:hypothetical protein [Candidatus Nanoarchaeia archaeon]
MKTKLLILVLILLAGIMAYVGIEGLKKDITSAEGLAGTALALALIVIIYFVGRNANKKEEKEARLKALTEKIASEPSLNPQTLDEEIIKSEGGPPEG